MELRLLELFFLGGWAMWPLVLFSVATLFVVAERAIVFVRSDLRVDTDAATEREPEFHRRAARVLYAWHRNPDHREPAFEAAAKREIRVLERGLDLLVAMGSIAPITGFLGTVSGMITAFQTIANAAESDVNAQLVAGGIFEALITTAFGLAIAIVAITAYNIFTHMVDRFSADLEEAAEDLSFGTARS